MLFRSIARQSSRARGKSSGGERGRSDGPTRGHSKFGRGGTEPRPDAGNSSGRPAGAPGTAGPSAPARTRRGMTAPKPSPRPASRTFDSLSEQIDASRVPADYVLNDIRLELRDRTPAVGPSSDAARAGRVKPTPRSTFRVAPSTLTCLFPRFVPLRRCRSCRCWWRPPAVRDDGARVRDGGEGSDAGGARPRRRRGRHPGARGGGPRLRGFEMHEAPNPRKPETRKGAERENLRIWAAGTASSRA